MNPEHCWDCIHHQRTLVSTSMDRPLFYTSICAKGFEKLNPELCLSFHHFDLPSSEPVTVECGLCHPSIPQQPSQ